jgi:hypothetical protein
MRRPATLAAAAAAATALLAPGCAQAHLVATGMGPLYDGVTHFGLSPEDVLPVAALALFAGLKGPPQARAAALGLVGGWFAGGTLALAGLHAPAMALAIAGAGLLMIVGLTLAWNLRLGAAGCCAAAAILGLVRGAADMTAVTASPAHALTLVGMCVAVAAAFVLAASVTLPMRRFWMIVAARVAGSWIAALGLLLAGWIARYGAVAR